MHRRTFAAVFSQRSIDPLAPGAPRPLTNQSANTVLSPVIRVALNIAGGVLSNIATDVVTLYANGVSVGTATLIAGDIVAGFVDITSSARPGTPDSFTARSAHGVHAGPLSAVLSVTYSVAVIDDDWAAWSVAA